jgi:hypothetical protein
MIDGLLSQLGTLWKQSYKEIDFEAKIELRQGLISLIEWGKYHKSEVEQRRNEIGRAN